MISSSQHLADKAHDLDALDPLAHFRDYFVSPADGVLYLDGNSLGRLPKATMSAVAHTVEHEWGTDLVRSWKTWINLPTAIGDELAFSKRVRRMIEPYNTVGLCDPERQNMYPFESPMATSPPE